MKPLASLALLVLSVAFAVACSGADGDTSASDVTDVAAEAGPTDATPEAVPDVAEGEPADPGQPDAPPDGDDDDTEDEVTPAPAKVRALMLSPDAPPVDVELEEDTSPTWTGVAYLHGTPFVDVPGDEIDFHVMPQGGDDYDAYLHEHEIAVEPGSATTLVAYGPRLGMQPLVLQDDLSPVEEGHARVRFVHTAKAEGRFDVWRLPPVGERHGDELLAEGLPYGTGGGWLELHAEPLRLGLDLDRDGTMDRVFDPGALASGAILSLYAVSEGAGPILARQDADGTITRLEGVVVQVPETRTRVIHLAPDGPTVDVLANDEPQPVFTQVAYLQGTPYAPLPSGTYDLHLAPVGGSVPDAVCTCSDAALAADRAYTVVAFGPLVDLMAVALEDQLDGLAGDKLRAQVFHAAAGLGKVDLWLRDEMPSMPNMPPEQVLNQLAYGTAEAVDLGAGAHVLGLDLNGDATPEATFDLPALAAGAHVNLFAVAEAAGPFLVLQLSDGSVSRIDPR